jgi:hypothetical protein
MILVNSFGATGTTMFIEYLWYRTLSEGGIVAPFLVWDDGRCGTGKNQCHGFKHISSPPQKDTGKQHTGVDQNTAENPIQPYTGVHKEVTDVIIEKAIYLYVNPLEAILTFFNNLIIAKIEGDFVPWIVRHTRSMGGDWQALLELVGEAYIEDTNHEFSSAYFMHDHDSGIDIYSRQNKDLLGLEKHFDNWTAGNSEYPILAVKYETMWEQENIRKIAHFLDLDGRFVNNFPLKRPRKLYHITPNTRSRLEMIYQDLIGKMHDAPPCMLNGEEY